MNAVAKTMIFFFILILGSCASEGFRNGSRELGRKIKRIAVIDVYVDRDIPSGKMSGMSQAGFGREYRNALYGLVMKNRKVFDFVAEDILKNGRFKLDTVAVKADPGNNLSVEGEEFKSPSGYIWKYNYGLSLKRGFIRDIAEKYNADAVFFHYLHVNKRWHYCFIKTQEGGRAYAVVPKFILLYTPVIYGKDGSVIFDGRCGKTETYGSHIGNDSAQFTVMLEGCADDAELETISPDRLDKKAFGKQFLRNCLTRDGACEPRAAMKSLN